MFPLQNHPSVQQKLHNGIVLMLYKKAADFTRICFDIGFRPSAFRFQPVSGDYSIFHKGIDIGFKLLCFQHSAVPVLGLLTDLKIRMECIDGTDRIIVAFQHIFQGAFFIDDITGDGRLWAVRYDGATDNELFRLFDQWNDVMWLRNFFKENINDLNAYFKITDINQAISDTIDDSEILEGVILDISPEADLDLIFRPLSNNRTIAEMLEKMKARGERTNRHDSWLRIYAIRLADGKYIITGGAIKLTATMQERPHTQAELDKIEKVRRYLLDEGIVDDDGFIDYISEL